MGKLFNFKKMATKIAFIVTASVVIIGGAACVYMQTRIIDEIDNHARLYLRYQLEEAAQCTDRAFSEAIYKVSSLNNFVEVSFDVDEYIDDAENYFSNITRPEASGFIHNIINRGEYISAAYFAVDPHLSGSPLVNEIYYEKIDGAIEALDPSSLEDYADTECEDMQWYFGAYNSGEPYWTGVYLWEADLETAYYVSYVQPVIINGTKVGVVGVDIHMGYIEELIRDIELYDSGLAVLEDKDGEIVDPNNFIGTLTEDEVEFFINSAYKNDGQSFHIRLNRTNYMAAQTFLINDFSMYALAPRGEVMSEVNASMIRFAIIFSVVVILIIIFAYNIGKKIGAPIVDLSGFLDKAGKKGDIFLNEKELEKLRTLSQLPDEVGRCSQAAYGLFSHINKISDLLEKVSQGDLTVRANLLSDKDVLGKSLTNMIEQLRKLFDEIDLSSDRVTLGASQIADGAQTLANGSTQQAATLQELSASISDISDKSEQNAQLTGNASTLALEIMKKAEKGSGQMEHMISAVNEINQANQNISKVIKVIDDIAFQTNILALNAAVEAARAGEAGKGFAVVAEEVRNLAGKSAQSAKETGVLIANSMEKAELGTKIANETAESLSEIVDGITKSTNIITEIAQSSDEQTVAVGQINTAVTQVTDVVQQNSATAEESAASSQEMSDQSGQLKSLIEKFQIK
jgi:methyl-accepting chemotaxis protein